MEFIHRILSFGISEDTDTTTANRIKVLNAFYLVMLIILTISIIISSSMGIKPLLYINIGFLAAFALAYLAFPPFRKLKVNSFFAMSLTGLMMLISYLFIPELSSSVLLAFFLLFPIFAISVDVRRSVWIAITLGIIILLVNFIPLSDAFAPLKPLSLAIFLLIYSVIIVISYYVERTQRRLIERQAKTADYYETEIRHKDVFISQLSHKLRTSLSNITLINNLVHDSRMSTAQKELLDTLKTSTFDLINDVNELVEIATPTFIDFKQSILSFNLKEALEDTIGILKSDIDFKADIKLECTEHISYHVIGDPSLLRSILINLIKGINDFRQFEDVPTLFVMIDYESQNLFRLRFALQSDFKDQSDLRVLINKIQKGAEQRASKLNNANHLLALTASSLEYSFEGTRPQVYFYLDISKDPTRKVSESESLRKTDPAAEKVVKRSLKDASLLLVEDNAINQKIVLLSLTKQVRQIDIANNGKEALDMFGTKKYDLILMDIQMPVMDGITATKKIREIESTSDNHVPIIAITANALAGDRDNCLAAGVDDYVSKPFQVDEVIKKIFALINQ